MSANLVTFDTTFTTLSTADFATLRSNADVGAVRIKSLHMDYAFSPLATATKPVVVNISLHRVHEDVADANLIETEGTRVKFERLVIGRVSDRYYRMWLKQINLERGYKLVVHVDGDDIAGGAPSWGLGARWWELAPDSP